MCTAILAMSPRRIVLVLIYCRVADVHCCDPGGDELVLKTRQAVYYEGRTESHEQLFFFFACELGTADEGECGGRWNQLLCYP